MSDKRLISERDAARAEVDRMRRELCNLADELDDLGGKVRATKIAAMLHKIRDAARVPASYAAADADMHSHDDHCALCFGVCGGEPPEDCPYEGEMGALYLRNLRALGPSERTARAVERACTCGQHSIADPEPKCEHGREAAHRIPQPPHKLARVCPGPSSAANPQ